MWRSASSGLALVVLAAACDGGGAPPRVAVCGRGDRDLLAAQVSEVELRFLDDAGTPVGEVVRIDSAGGHVAVDIPSGAASVDVSGLDADGAPVAAGSGAVSAEDGGCACLALTRQAFTACGGVTCELVADSCRFADESGAPIGAQTHRFGERASDDIGDVTIDTFLQEDEADSGHDDTELEAGPSPTRVALVRFDLASLPASAVVESARLTVRVCAAADCASSHTFEVREVLEEWSEAATWNDRLPGTAWAAAGCGAGACSSAAIGGLVEPDVAGADEPIDLDPDTVAGWLADPAGGNGLAIVPTSDTGTAVHLEASEADAADAPPSLEITYRLE
jgi:hypothetical protein